MSRCHGNITAAQPGVTALNMSYSEPVAPCILDLDLALTDDNTLPVGHWLLLEMHRPETSMVTAVTTPTKGTTHLVAHVVAMNKRRLDAFDSGSESSSPATTKTPNHQSASPERQSLMLTLPPSGPPALITGSASAPPTPLAPSEPPCPLDTCTSGTYFPADYVKLVFKGN